MHTPTPAAEEAKTETTKGWRDLVSMITFDVYKECDLSLDSDDLLKLDGLINTAYQAYQERADADSLRVLDANTMLISMLGTPSDEENARMTAACIAPYSLEEFPGQALR